MKLQCVQARYTLKDNSSKLDRLAEKTRTWHTEHSIATRK